MSAVNTHLVFVADHLPSGSVGIDDEGADSAMAGSVSVIAKTIATATAARW